jgi:uncharacterized protein (UPF0335 family)
MSAWAYEQIQQLLKRVAKLEMEVEQLKNQVNDTGADYIGP